MKAEQFARITRALADPRRLEILERIAAHPETACSALADECPVSQPTVSHHVKELLIAGLITARREAKYFFYRLDRRVWREYLSEMRRRVPLKSSKA
jgi:ArsR family transcriptional regulator, arsenate/arsenite/antimonite-responsive transcriptional repressor